MPYTHSRLTFSSIISTCQGSRHPSHRLSGMSGMPHLWEITPLCFLYSPLSATTRLLTRPPPNPSPFLIHPHPRVLASNRTHLCILCLDLGHFSDLDLSRYHPQLGILCAPPFVSFVPIFPLFYLTLTHQPQNNLHLCFGRSRGPECPKITQFSMYLDHSAELAPNHTPSPAPSPVPLHAPPQLYLCPSDIIPHARNPGSRAFQSGCPDPVATTQPTTGLAALAVAKDVPSCPGETYTNLFTTWANGQVTSNGLTTTTWHGSRLQPGAAEGIATPATISMTDRLDRSGALPLLHRNRFGGDSRTLQLSPHLSFRSPHYINSESTRSQLHPESSLFPPPQLLHPALLPPALSQPSLFKGSISSPLLILPPLPNRQHSHHRKLLHSYDVHCNVLHPSELPSSPPAALPSCILHLPIDLNAHPPLEMPFFPHDDKQFLHHSTSAQKQTSFFHLPLPLPTRCNPLLPQQWTVRPPLPSAEVSQWLTRSDHFPTQSKTATYQVLKLGALPWLPGSSQHLPPSRSLTDIFGTFSFPLTLSASLALSFHFSCKNLIVYIHPAQPTAVLVHLIISNGPFL